MKTMREPVEDVLVVGGGPAGAAAALFLARAGLRVVGVDAEGSPLYAVRRVENYPGRPDAPSGVELLEAMKDQARKAGARWVLGRVQDLEDLGGVFAAQLASGERRFAERLLLATGDDLWLVGILGLEREGPYVATDAGGRTSYPRVYAAGKLRGLVPEHAAQSAGDGVWVATQLISDLRGEPYRDHG